MSMLIALNKSYSWNSPLSKQPLKLNSRESRIINQHTTGFTSALKQYQAADKELKSWVRDVSYF